MPAVRSLYRVPLVFFALAACFGLLLRWHVVNPFDWLTPPYGKVADALVKAIRRL